MAEQKNVLVSEQSWRDIYKGCKTYISYEQIKKVLDLLSRHTYALVNTRFQMWKHLWHTWWDSLIGLAACLIAVTLQ